MKNTLQKTLIALAFLPIFTNITYALNLEVKEEKSYSGVVVAKGWTRSGDSYCQGGSDYYVLQTELDGELLLNSFRDPINKNDDYDSFNKWQDKLNSFEGKKVTILGSHVTAVFESNEHCPEPMMQCMSGPIGCHWIRISNLELFD